MGDRRESLRPVWRSALCRVGDGELVGVCGLNIDPYAADDRIGRLRHLYVRSAFRRRGEGGHLVTKAIETARGRFEVLRLCTTNSPAAQFYEPLGFRPAEGATQDATHVMQLATSRPTAQCTRPMGSRCSPSGGLP